MDEPTSVQKLAAEVIGTAFLVFVGVGSVPATLIVNGDAPFTMADLGMISFAFGTIVVATVYALGHISGNHINPAVTLGLAVTGKFPWSKVPAYIAAQLVGAIIGAAAILGVLGQAASEVGLGVAAFGAGVGAGQAFVAEFVGTFILVFTVFGVIHRKAAAGFAGLAIGLVVFAAIIPVAPATGRRSTRPARSARCWSSSSPAGPSNGASCRSTCSAELSPASPRRWSTRCLADQLPNRRRCDHDQHHRTRADARVTAGLSGGATVKKLINDPADVVSEALRGIAAAHPGAARRPPEQDHLPR